MKYNVFSVLVVIVLNIFHSKRKSDFPKILKLFPNAEMKFIEGAGHWLHSEKPAEFLKLTLDFLNSKIVTKT